MPCAGSQGAEFAEEGWGNVMVGRRNEGRGSLAGKWLGLGGKKSREKLGEIEWL